MDWPRARARRRRTSISDDPGHGLYTITRWGNANEVSADVAHLLGRAPISFRQFAMDYRAAWLPLPKES
jgi:hypothetical protein